MPFNDKQLEAINSSINKNVIVSASAGSGKTEILAHKVLTVLTKGGLKPEELLVLTFTNKAAYEMKQRIIKTIKENNPSDTILATKILSTHIQTFDAFAMYLVKTYSSYLKIPSNIQIVDSTLIDLLKKKYLDEIIESYLDSDNKTLIELIKKEDSFKYENTKEIISNIYDVFSSLSKEEINKIKDISKTDNKYYQKLFDDYLVELTIKNLLYPLSLLCYLNSSKFDFNLDYDELIKSYLGFIKEKNDNDLLEYCKNVVFDNGEEECNPNKWAVPLRDKIILIIESILSKNYDQLDIDMLKPFTGNVSKGGILYKDSLGDFNNNFKNIYRLATSGFKPQIDNICSTKEELQLIFDIVDILDKKIKEYKLVSNSYEYKDISQMAISLFDIKEARDILEGKFKFIIVDEYQDTNDEQERFISLLSKNAKLFVVGDVKQSIYRFRGSKVELFINRKKNLASSKDGQVIDMNNNYRSLEKVLFDINKIFNNYMSKKNGGVIYSSNEETLQYDKKANIYDEKELPYPRDSYGINIISYDCETEAKTHENECDAIIQDIKKKISEKHLVLDRVDNKKILRPCKYSDFAILVRRKRSFTDYTSYFEKAGIPLINQVEVDLKDVDVFLLIKSILYLLSIRLNLVKGDELHYFTSIARSYIFGNTSEYTDENIYKIISSKKSDSKSNLYEDCSIIKKIDEIANKYYEYPFNYLFNEIVESFGLLSKLNTIGSVNDNIEKVYSLYSQLTLNLDSGLGLKEYILSLEEYNKYRLELKYKYEANNENAVQLMSLHGSKGLEFPIVYLPVSDNSVDVKSDKSPVKISTKYGVLLPNYFPYLDENKICKSFLFDLYKRNNTSYQEEVSENARLYYVLFTRAKENIYIVGKKPKDKKGVLSLFNLIEFGPHEYIANEDYLYSVFDETEIKPLLNDYYSRCNKLITFELNRNKYLDNISLDDTTLIENYYSSILKNFRDRKIEMEAKIYKMIYDYLFAKINSKQIDLTKEDLSPLINASEYKDNQAIKKHFDSLKKIIEQIVLLLLKVVEKKPINIFDISYTGVNTYMYKAELDVNAYLSEKKELEDKLFSTNNTNDQRIIISHVETKIGNDSLFFLKKEKKKASKELVDINIDTSVLDFGTNLHKLLELTDFNTKDTSFINSLSPELKKMKIKIDKFLNQDFLKDLKKAKIYKEYEFYSKDNLSKGSIDCLLVYDDKAIIIDYKLKNIDDDKYADQLSYYAKEVSRLFNISNIKCYLYSILNEELKEIKVN